MGRYGIEFVASPRHADGIVITGPITQNMAEPLQICFDAVPDPKLVILAGTDAISGGIFAGSKALDRKFLDNHFIDLYVPGNPVHPLTFINGLLQLIRAK
jgi:Ni,Fe-hydrogenase III small subunit